MNRPPLDNINEIAQFTSKLLDGAAQIARRYFEDFGHIQMKTDHSVVTIADQEIEQFLRQQIEHAYPDHGIIGEEQQTKPANSEYSWIIDPIDGTKAFIAGYPTFCTLIGLLKNDQPIFGAVDQPLMNKRWMSHQTGQESPITPSQTIIATSSLDFLLDSQLQQLRDWQAEHNITFLPAGDAYAYMMLLEGRISAVFDVALKPYDILPLIPILASNPSVNITFFDHNGSRPQPTGNVVVSKDAALSKQLLQILTTEH